MSCLRLIDWFLTSSEQYCRIQCTYRTRTSITKQNKTLVKCGTGVGLCPWGRMFWKPLWKGYFVQGELHFTNHMALNNIRPVLIPNCVVHNKSHTFGRSDGLSPTVENKKLLRFISSQDNLIYVCLLLRFHYANKTFLVYDSDFNNIECAHSGDDSYVYMFH